MGAEESRISGSNKCRNFSCRIHSKPSCKRWTIVHQCQLDVWKKSHRELFNFPEKIIECPFRIPNDCTSCFCLSRQNIINFQKKKSIFEISKQKKKIKIAEHFEYNHIPAHLSSIQNLHFKSILCSRNGLAIFHLARDLMTQFGIVDLHIHKFLGSFGKQSVIYSSDSVAAQISPDGTLCLLRLPLARNNRIGTLQLYSLRTRELLSELPLAPFCIVASINAPPLEVPPVVRSPVESSVTGLNPTLRIAAIIFDFDPRFVNSRIVVANMRQQKGSARSNTIEFQGSERPCLSLLRLPTWHEMAYTQQIGEACTSSVVRRRPNSRTARRRPQPTVTEALQVGADSDSNLSILKIFYSRAGHLIFALVINDTSCRCNAKHSVINFSNISASSGGIPSYSPQQLEAGRVASAPLPGCMSYSLNAFDSDTLSHLRVIRFDRPACPLHTCPTNFVPLMSRCGSRIALIAVATASLRPVLAKRPPTQDYSLPTFTQRMRVCCDQTESCCHLDSCGMRLRAEMTPRRLMLEAGSGSGGQTEVPTASPTRRVRRKHHLPLAHIEGEEVAPRLDLVRGTNPAIEADLRREFVFVYQLQPPPTLQAVVREKIVQLFPDERLDSLGLPSSLVAYLRFKPSYSCAGSCLSGSHTPLLMRRDEDSLASSLQSIVQTV